MSNSNKWVAGIKLGTTFSSIGQIDERGNIDLVMDKIICSHWIPSIVSYANSTCKVGEIALDDKKKAPHDVIYDVNRMLGHKYNDSIIQQLKSKWHFMIESSSNGNIEIKTSQGNKTPVQVVRDIIKYLIDLAQSKNGYTIITHAVITVPAYFSIKQRLQTEEAAKMAGLKVVHLINEPEAAIIGRWFIDQERNAEINKTVLAYHFGGATIAASLAIVYKDNITVVASSEEMEVGGRDIDSNLFEFYINKLNLQKLKNDTTKNDRAGERARLKTRKIYRECERAKLHFSCTNDDYIISPDIEFDDIYDTDVEITNKQFNSINESLINKLTNPIDAVFQDAKVKNLNITKNNVTNIILIGGSCKNRFVTKCLIDYFCKSTIQNEDPQDIVVISATFEAIRYFVKNKNDCVKDSKIYLIKRIISERGGPTRVALRFSIIWNDQGYWDKNDLDAYAIEPENTLINHANKKDDSTGGNLDTDITQPNEGEPACENITWPNLNQMKEGEYRLYVHQHAYRDGQSGFRALIEIEDQSYFYDYSSTVNKDQDVNVAYVTLRNGRFSIRHCLTYK